MGQADGIAPLFLPVPAALDFPHIDMGIHRHGIHPMVTVVPPALFCASLYGMAATVTLAR